MDRQTEQLAAAVRNADRSAVASALNLLDDQRPAVQRQARDLLDCLLQTTVRTGAHLVGMTGPPGVGKSTLSAALIGVWRRRNLRVGVLAVDPSSPLTGGALLGDRLRMNTNGDDDGVFIRSLSSRGEYGGLSAQVWPMSLVMLSCFDIVLLETVGVGQREVDIASSCDTTCFVAQPGSGDSIQFLKAGVLEVPHILVVNKSDMGELATRAHAELQGALGREHPDGGWQVPVMATSALERTGIDELADALGRHREHLDATGQLASRRHRYQIHWLIRRLESEYGQRGIRRLGGEQALLAEFGAPGGNPLEQYDICQQRLAQ